MPKPLNLLAKLDPIDSAETAGLRYVGDEMPGYSRKHQGSGFQYFDTSGKRISSEAHQARIQSLAIPPAWTQVWICPDPNGHLQATGRDDRGRKQYRYHPRWQQVRDETKYAHMIAFARALPRIRQRVKADLKLPGLPRNKVLATIVELLELSLIRVGNEEYARNNKSYGLTTLRNRHAQVRGENIRFTFKGKSGIEHNIDVHEPHLARIVKKCQDLPGQELFQYVDKDGTLQHVRSEDVNEYLRELSQAAFTAKDFRTWAGTVFVARALQELPPAANRRQTQKNIMQAIERVAQRLGNTPSVCKKCYVHPAVLEAYADGTLINLLRNHSPPARLGVRQRRSDERLVLDLLRKRLALEKNAGSLTKQLSRSIKKLSLNHNL